MTKSKVNVTTAQQVIDNLPEQTKRDVLFSLVGTLNASIVGTASSVASRIERSDLVAHEMEPRDVELLMSELDSRTDMLDNTRRVVRVTQNLRDQLLAVSNDDASGSILGTVEFMTRPNTNPRKLDKDLLKACLEAAGIGEIDVDHFDAINAMNAAQRAERLAGQRGIIEWLIEHVFTSHSHDVIGDDSKMKTINDVEDNVLENLPAQQVERLYEKLIASLNRSRDNTVLGIMNKDTRYSFSDLPIIAAAIKDAQGLDAHNVED